MPAVLTPRASSAARSPGMREITQICGRRARIAERAAVGRAAAGGTALYLIMRDANG